MKRFIMRRLITMLCTSGLLIITHQAMASGFQLWEQDGASVANYHAGYAALANDASTAWYNPAGITRIKNQQFVIGAVGITAGFKYRGSVTVIEPPFSQTFNDIVAQGGTFNFVPNLHYVAPITDRLGFGFSIGVPFGLKTDYGRSTPLRYAATLTSISVLDISPSLGFEVMDNFSVGAGFDIQKADAQFDNVGVLLIFPHSDTTSTNKARDTAYGYHLGALYQFTPCTRVGLSYHSQVVHHLSGTSKFAGPIADTLSDGPLKTKRSTARLTLPPYIALSGYHLVRPQVALMGSIIYTQWNTFNTLVLNNAAGAISPEPFLIEPSTNIQITIPEHYRNSWNISVGADYYINDQLFIRGGLGYDQSPVTTKYRNVQLPDNDRYIISFGGHFQPTKCIGFDLGWAHVFFNRTQVNPPAQPLGGEIVLTDGHANGSADVLGAQITWDIV